MSLGEVGIRDGTAEKLFESSEPFRSTPPRGGAYRGVSPLTPWSDEQRIREKKRKNSLKGSNRTRTQRSGGGGGGKDGGSKRKEKKDAGDAKSGATSRKSRMSTVNREEPKRKSSFQHHADIGQYMKEYRDVRSKMLAAHRNCACHGSYTREDIMKAYDSLVLPKFYHRSSAPPPGFQDTCSPDTDKDTLSDERSPSEETDPDAEDSSCERELSSPDARQRRNNLNLTPLRKHVRLPDMSNYPVQSVSGLGVKELVRLATARGETRCGDGRAGTATPKIQYSSCGEKKKLPDLPAHIQEKALCRIVELTLPKGLGCHTDGEEKHKEEKGHSLPIASEKVHHAGLDGEAAERRRVSRLDRLSEREDDALTVAIGTSRSCQSSVLSAALSPLVESPNGSGSKRTNTTVREMLTASVRDLHPFDPNGAADKGDKSTQKEAKKQTVSMKTLRNLGYKPSMRKFLQEIYTPARDTPQGANASCLISGKTIRKLSKSDIIDDAIPMPEPLPLPRAPVALTGSPQSQESVCATRLLKRARQRQLAAEAYESLRRVVTLEGRNRPKLAIFSKCDTVVKPQVSVRGVAL